MVVFSTTLSLSLSLRCAELRFISVVVHGSPERFSSGPKMCVYVKCVCGGLCLRVSLSLSLRKARERGRVVRKVFFSEDDGQTDRQHFMWRVCI